MMPNLRGSSKMEAVVLILLVVVIFTPFTQPFGGVSDAGRGYAGYLSQPLQKPQL